MVFFAPLFIASTPLALLVLPLLQPVTMTAAFLYTLAAALSFPALAWVLIAKTERRFVFIAL